MAERKLNLSALFSCGFLLYYFVLVVADTGTGSSDSDLEQSKRPKEKEQSSEMSLMLERFEAQDRRIRELEKSHEELNKRFESSQKKCDDRFESLKKEVEEITEENASARGVFPLTTRVRGPPGKKGEKGDSRCELIVPKEAPAAAQKGQTGQIQIQVPSQSPPGPKGDSYQARQSILSCSDAIKILPSPRSARQIIYPHGNNRTKLGVLCDFDVDGGGWTVIQKRSSGPIGDFYRDWSEYSRGFGSLSGNFWLGLDNIHALTKNGDQELRIDLEDFEGNKAYAKYSSFSVSDASDFYRLTISGFSPDSTAGDSMTNSTGERGYILNGMRFSTEDMDNDLYSGNCALYYGGWWNNRCSFANLNAAYLKKGERGDGMRWYTWKGNESMAKTEIKIRKRKP